MACSGEAVLASPESPAFQERLKFEENNGPDKALQRFNSSQELLEDLNHSSAGAEYSSAGGVSFTQRRRADSASVSESEGEGATWGWYDSDLPTSESQRHFDASTPEYILEDTLASQVQGERCA